MEPNVDNTTNESTNQNNIDTIPSTESMSGKTDTSADKKQESAEYKPKYQPKHNKGNNTPFKKKTNFKKRPEDTTPQPPNTIYNAVKQHRNDDFARKDLRSISHIVKTKFQEKFGEIDPEIIEQDEDGKTFRVYCYPESMRKEISNISE